MSINVCKECGKQFEAKSPRIMYCSDIHYRPCPVCGKPVVAKYLSDPARQCDDCRHKSRAVAQHIAKVTQVTSSIVDDVREFVGPECCGFRRGHRYLINIDHDDYGYQIKASRDITEECGVNIMICASSKTTIDQYFVKHN